MHSRWNYHQMLNCFLALRFSLMLYTFLQGYTTFPIVFSWLCVTHPGLLLVKSDSTFVNTFALTVRIVLIEYCRNRIWNNGVVRKSEQEELGKREEVHLLVSFLEKTCSDYKIACWCINWLHGIATLEIYSQVRLIKECIFYISFA